MSELTRKGLDGRSRGGRGDRGGVTGAGDDRDDDDGIVGSWYGRVTADDPALGSFEVISFHRDGIVTDAHRLYIPATPFGPLLETSGHGAEDHAHRLHRVLRFLLQQAPPSAGAPVGTDNVRLNIRLERGGNRFTGRFESTIRDTAGNAVFTATGAIAGERIVACARPASTFWTTSNSISAAPWATVPLAVLRGLGVPARERRGSRPRRGTSSSVSQRV